MIQRKDIAWCSKETTGRTLQFTMALAYHVAAQSVRVLVVGIWKISYIYMQLFSKVLSKWVYRQRIHFILCHHFLDGVWAIKVAIEMEANGFLWYWDAEVKISHLSGVGRGREMKGKSAGFGLTALRMCFVETENIRRGDIEVGGALTFFSCCCSIYDIHEICWGKYYHWCGNKNLKTQDLSMHSSFTPNPQQVG